MKKLHSFGSWERHQAGLLKEILEREGIACLIRNEELFAALGEIPFLECSPEIWVIDNETYPRAKMFIESWLKSCDHSSSKWTCPGCGETLEGHFGACWSCGTLRE